VPIDTELSDYIDVDGRTADYTMSAVNDADLLADGIQSAELPKSHAAVSKFVYSLGSVSTLYLLMYQYYIPYFSLQFFDTVG